MTDFDMRCGEKSVREYVRSAMTGTTLKQSVPMILCASCLTVMPILGIIGFVMTQSPIMLVLTGCALLLAAGVIVFMVLTVNSTADKLLKALNSRDGLVCSVSDSNIVIVRDNRPVKVIGWDSITEMNEGKTGFFLKDKENELIILDKNSVLSGSVAETSEIFAAKAGAAK